MFCPKCHQPLEEGEEEYICCAGETLQWRCDACAKVSEGFAFPYGQCPHCGGKLAALTPRTLAGAAALEGIRTAFEIELGGRAFYERAAAESGDPGLAELFARFAAMEGEHMQTLARRYHVPVPAASGFDVGRAAIYAGVEGRPDNPEDLFRIAIALEERAAGYFTTKAAEAAQGTLERELYRELAAEEREHAGMLAAEFERWRLGKGGQMVLPRSDSGVC